MEHPSVSSSVEVWMYVYRDSRWASGIFFGTTDYHCWYVGITVTHYSDVTIMATLH